ncbi:MAG: histidinol phosphate phosphatase [Lachnospiraceae bacterium]|nr:histidinol phosphate phosphatase [Lachnospiraceae bacterium]
MDYFEGFLKVAQEAGLDEIYLLEHTHQFMEFERVYEPIKAYNDFQYNWITKRMNGSINEYIDFINKVKDTKYPVKVKFGLEVCYIPETADLLVDILKNYDFDFLTGSVHWIDGWGFDHMGQKELWESKNVDEVYKRYYDIMFQLCESGLFGGLAHPDSIKCFGYKPNIDLTDCYQKLAELLNKHGMYAENSGGLRLNYSPNLELGLNPQLLSILRKNNVQIETASDAHKQRDVGANIRDLEGMLKCCKKSD